MFAFPFEAAGISSNTKGPHRAFCGELCAGADATICPCGFVLVCHFSFLRPVAAQTSARRRHRGQGLSPLRAAQMYICAMLARTFSFSRGLVFLCTALEFSFRKFSRYADRFCGFQQKRSDSSFPVHTTHCYHFQAIHYQFFGKDRLSGQIDIRFFAR